MKTALQLSLALALVPFTARAQTAPPAAPGSCESPEEIAARVHYERALRAELDGRAAEAQREAEATLRAQPVGPFADASRELLLRLTRPAPAPSTPAATAATAPGVRSELIISSTLDGLYLGGLVAYAGGFEAKGTVGALMLGTGAGLAASILISAGRVVPRSTPALIELGAAYGTFASLLAEDIADNYDSHDIPRALLFGVSAGTLAGILSSPYLGTGDAGAATAGLIYGATLPLLVEGALSSQSHGYLGQWSALIGGTAGLLALPLINRELGFSRARWNLITLGGGAGALFGFGGAYLLGAADGPDTRGFVALGLLGTLGGLAVTAYLTNGFDEEPAGSHALLHYQEGSGLSLGALASAVAPLRLDGRTGVQLTAFDAKF